MKALIFALLVVALVSANQHKGLHQCMVENCEEQHDACKGSPVCHQALQCFNTCKEQGHGHNCRVGCRDATGVNQNPEFQLLHQCRATCKQTLAAQGEQSVGTSSTSMGSSSSDPDNIELAANPAMHQCMVENCEEQRFACKGNKGCLQTIQCFQKCHKQGLGHNCRVGCQAATSASKNNQFLELHQCRQSCHETVFGNNEEETTETEEEEAVALAAVSPSQRHALNACMQSECQEERFACKGSNICKKALHCFEHCHAQGLGHNCRVGCKDATGVSSNEQFQLLHQCRQNCHNVVFNNNEEVESSEEEEASSMNNVELDNVEFAAHPWRAAMHQCVSNNCEEQHDACKGSKTCNSALQCFNNCKSQGLGHNCRIGCRDATGVNQNPEFQLLATCRKSCKASVQAEFASANDESSSTSLGSEASN